jgi:DNA polymerase III epsilon subunit-like protein
MKHLRGSIIAAIDVETTGTDPRRHEIVQIAIVPLGPDLKPLKEAFYTLIKPEYPERADPTSLAVHGITLEELEEANSQAKTADLLTEWVKSFKLHSGCRLIPLSHSYTFEFGFLTAWLGPALRDELFHYHPRDAMVLALAMNDRAGLSGQPIPFESVSLNKLCKHFGIVNKMPHDALYDCLAEIEVYKALLQ